MTEALGGEVIRSSAALTPASTRADMDRAYGDERNPIVSKSEFVLSLFEQLIGDGMVTAKEKSTSSGRCTEQVFCPTSATVIRARCPRCRTLPSAPKCSRNPKRVDWRCSSDGIRVR